MQTIKAIVVSGLIMLFFCSCEKTVFIDVSETEPKIVMNGILSQSSGLWLNVSESTGTSTPQINSYIPIEDATVHIFKGEEPETSITESNIGNYYSTEFTPQIDEPYEIRVNVDGMPEAKAVVMIPKRVEISDYDISTVVQNQANSNETINKEVDFFVNFSISDPEAIRNFYMLGVYYLENETYHPLQADTEDPVINIHIKDGVDVLAWDDSDFDGKSREFDVRFRGQKPEGFQTQILISLYSIQEEYFDYLKSYAKNFTVLNGTGLLYEPALVSTNISGGYGIVAAVATSNVIVEYIF